MSAGSRSASFEHRVSVAPMMDWTDRHCRYFLRGFSPRVLLYTEMITCAAILRGDRQRLLGFDSQEHPLALQLGGSDPAQLAEAARIGEQASYDEINLNCGCPSDRVSAGAFGACLMAQPQLVAECVAAMRAVVRVPVTVKLRIGVVEAGRREAMAAAGAEYTDDDFARLLAFAQAVRAAGADALIVHARKAVLGGLSPKDNREVPPLRFDVVRRLGGELPGVPLVLNGGLRAAQAAAGPLEWCDGVMLGREAYHRPHVLAELHALAWPDDGWRAPSRLELAQRMVDYAAREVGAGVRLSAIARHTLGLYAHEPGAREFRRRLSEGAREPGASPSLFVAAARRAERLL
ncbi:MAG: tRNA dihydrouridine(20/20a) synthase DusA [Steroidobacteraceae bacterium]|nr:tRNA dihydrouridine(20/20a) synthase DusA [Steroidobacteraceae bacterium]